ncbi:M15 family metallopeptidase [Enterococcus saccharolyticus]|uniref:Peptidase M15 n=1 Tax=Candidatus Enterococcus willemsii TaxID=1857215 RepID=A0ABQ6Z1G5_9ENTE|nr:MULTISPECIES: M15 family metallopeptidase [Enterococcus]KAF1305271.1 peptidase M15 [Enterococcus sp. CU12B]MCD5002473.1 M15 family metallopeptidase [Enterococcus saccharolyticus]
MKKTKVIILVILGIAVIYGINRVVTKLPEEPETSERTNNKAMPSEEKEHKKQSDLPDGKVKDWNLLLVGPKHPLEKDFPDENFMEIKGTPMQLDKRVIQAYEDLSQAANDAGFPLAIVSAYRSVSYQEQVFQQNVDLCMSQGMTKEEAIAKTKETITEPGYSEHHTGLAIDIVDEHWQMNYPKEILDEEFGESEGGKWLAKHAREFGFIVRYPKDKESITQITYEPWHFRYVGVEHAQYIEEHQLTLEEYIDLLKEK